MLERLRARGVDPVEHRRTEGGPLSGTKFAITGTLGRPRADIKADIEAQGGKVVASVTKGTNYLIATLTRVGGVGSMPVHPAIPS